MKAFLDGELALHLNPFCDAHRDYQRILESGADSRSAEREYQRCLKTLTEYLDSFKNPPDSICPTPIPGQVGYCRGYIAQIEANIKRLVDQYQPVG
jgi:hypothetical protein